MPRFLGMPKYGMPEAMLRRPGGLSLKCQPPMLRRQSRRLRRAQGGRASVPKIWGGGASKARALPEIGNMP